MMFGSPSHRLETQIQATARVLELNASVVYLPGIMLISFGDDATHTSETKFLKQATGLDLGKLLATHKLYWNVRQLLICKKRLAEFTGRTRSHLGRSGQQGPRCAHDDPTVLLVVANPDYRWDGVFLHLCGRILRVSFQLTFAQCH
jgi:hypothetical protein